MNNPHRPPAGGRSVLQARPAWLLACLAAVVLAGVPGSVVFGSLRG